MGSSAEFEKKIVGRVLFTGNGIPVIDDIMAHLPVAYQTQRCPIEESDITLALNSFAPHVIVVCLSYESDKALSAFTALSLHPEHCYIPVIAIGSEDDCENFTNNVFQEKMKIFTRPLDKPLFEETLELYVKESIEMHKDDERENAELETFASEKLLAAEDVLLKKIKKMTSDTERKTILVVDDDISMLSITKLYLEELFEVIAVPSGRLALKYLSKKPADLVLLDYMMPDEDGPEVLRKIRTESPYPNIPVLFLTGVSDKDMVLKGLEHRPKGYLLKPVTREVLLEKATEILLGL